VPRPGLRRRLGVGETAASAVGGSRAAPNDPSGPDGPPRTLEGAPLAPRSPRRSRLGALATGQRSAAYEIVGAIASGAESQRRDHVAERGDDGDAERGAPRRKSGCRLATVDLQVGHQKRQPTAWTQLYGTSPGEHGDAVVAGPCARLAVAQSETRVRLRP
jgi:hypothetical protein